MNKFKLLYSFFIFLNFLFQQIRQKRFDRLDLNKDNIVTQDEFEARNQKFFLEIDKNKDESLTKREMFKKRKKIRNILE